jgi:hypothetical protein
MLVSPLLLYVSFQLSNDQVNELMECLPSPLKVAKESFEPDTKLPTPEVDYCPYPFDVKCSAKHAWRSVDGTCNNLKQPMWGASFQPFARFVPPVYADGW